MKAWVMASVYAMAAAGIVMWMEPSAASWERFSALSAAMVFPMRLAVALESRCGCWLGSIFS